MTSPWPGPRPTSLVVKKGIENPVADVLRNSGPGVADTDLCPSFAKLGRDGDYTRFFCRILPDFFLYRMGRVDEQISITCPILSLRHNTKGRLLLKSVTTSAAYAVKACLRAGWEARSSPRATSFPDTVRRSTLGSMHRVCLQAPFAPEPCVRQC